MEKQTIIFQKKRTSSAPHLTKRDLRLFLTLSKACYLTTPQIQTLFWQASDGTSHSAGRQKSCQERLRRLSKHSYIRRIMPFIRQGDSRQPYIYALDKRGAQMLSGEMGVDMSVFHWRPKNAELNSFYLRHFLAINEFRIAVGLACERGPVTLSGWLSDRELKSEGMKDYVTITGPNGAKDKTVVVPDACFTLNQNGRKATFFVEVDLGTLTIRPSLWERRGWTRKVLAYQAYLGSEACRNRYGKQDVQVLTVTTTDKRRKHLQEASQIMGAGMAFWFTILKEATDPAKLVAEPIWHRIGQANRFSLLG